MSAPLDLEKLKALPRPERPWRQERTHDAWTEIRQGYGLSNRMVADCLSEADGALVVAAVNTHHDLVAELQGALSLLKGMRERAAAAEKRYDDALALLADAHADRIKAEKERDGALADRVPFAEAYCAPIEKERDALKAEVERTRDLVAAADAVCAEGDEWKLKAERTEASEKERDRLRAWLAFWRERGDLATADADRALAGEAAP